MPFVTQKVRWFGIRDLEVKTLPLLEKDSQISYIFNSWKLGDSEFCVLPMTMKCRGANFKPLGYHPYPLYFSGMNWILKTDEIFENLVHLNQLKTHSVYTKGHQLHP
jgi:hypothetical protein